MRRLLDHALGRYIALVEGDDYWTCAEKLQRQVEFLDRRPDYSGCFHNATVVYEGHPDRNELYITGPMPECWDVRQIASAGRNVIPTCSVMFRKPVFDIPDWFYGLPFGDWSFHLLNAHHGPFCYIDENFGTYRVHAGGTWSTKPVSFRLPALIEGARLLDRHFDYRYHSELSRSICIGSWSSRSTPLERATTATRYGTWQMRCALRSLEACCRYLRE